MLVTLGVSVLGSATESTCCRLCPVLLSATGNLSKLTIVLTLVRSLTPVMMYKRTRLLFYARLMRVRLILLPLLSRLGADVPEFTEAK